MLNRTKRKQCRLNFIHLDAAVENQAAPRSQPLIATAALQVKKIKVHAYLNLACREIYPHAMNTW